ncbi:hypothetical protein DL93DRAFT_2208961 [Clavulina sp. PMI_390]|nr:hypothetical protein DL93DRAFT_2208961 [Clavulina sp. PMI_390]
MSVKSSATAPAATTVKTRLRIFAAADVAKHTTKRDCWVIRDGKVYDVSPFVDDHPGGDDLIMAWAGKDIGAIMADRSEHEHSDSAYAMLSEYLVGKIGAAATIVDENWEATDDFHPEETLPEEDFAQCEFLDLSKPLLRQVWESNWSKEFYLQQVHQPRHVTKTARLFGPNVLEMLTRTEWYVVPLVWAPIFSFLYLRSTLQFAGLAPPTALQHFHEHLPFSVAPLLSSFNSTSAPIAISSAAPYALSSIPASAFLKSGACFFLGNVIWTILEYTLHRFLFHIDAWLPDTPFFLMLHFLLHGIHHYLPMDGLRLVMPPILFFSLQLPFTQLAHVIFPTAVANGIISGAFAFYVLYDCMHYALHHTKLPEYVRQQKKYHLAHHYKNFELGYGVTSKFWDWVFGTMLVV